ncbi:MAG: hypothetical protein AAF125_21935, partial [Chloroflexota bacterium]
MAVRLRVRPLALALCLLTAMLVGAGDDAPCEPSDCAAFARAWVLRAWWGPPPLVVEGAGDVIGAPSAEVSGCTLTPSTGQGSGVNVRALPDVESTVVGDIPLGEYRPVSAISESWYQTVTRGGGAGFVAAGVTALVG